jgi:hypothetical protein
VKNMAKRGNRNIAQELNEQYGVGANHARYRKNGLWYHPLDEFPAAYFDANGYILFKTREDYETCDYLTI